MTIDSVEIRAFYSGRMQKCEPFPWMEEHKSLPMLSIVQPLVGGYDIALDGGSEQTVGAYGVYAAPRGREQHIRHLFDERRQLFYAHWIFLDVVINRLYAFEDVFDIPLILPAGYNAEICRLLDKIDAEEEYPFANYGYIYQLLDILSKVSTRKEPALNVEVSLRDYISRHYPEKLTPETLAERFSLSVPTLYRVFSQHFGMSPCNFINDYRLQRAVLLLEHRDQSVKEVAAAVGFADEYYFSKLFKRKYGIAPARYREQTRADETGVAPELLIAATEAARAASDFNRCIDPQPQEIVRPDK